MKIYLLILGFCVAVAGQLSSQTAHKLLREGNHSYANGSFSEAELYYRKSKEKDNGLKSNYNLGNATYEQERYEEAIDHYMNAAKKSENKLQESDAFYNLGNAQFNNQELDEAIESYKQSLRLNPDNKEAMYNLGVSKLVKHQMEQQQQEQEQQDGDESQENEEQQEQDGEPQENEEQQDGQGQEENEEEQEEAEEQSMEENAFDSTRLEKQSLDSLDAAKLLQIIQSEEQKVQEKLRKFSSDRKKPDKDW